MTDQPTNCITLNSPATEEIIRLDKEGFHYRDQFVEDAGEAHRLMVEFLRQGTAPILAKQPVGPTDEELMDLAEEAWVPFAKSQPHPQGHPWDLVLARAVLARWGNYPVKPDSSPIPTAERWPEFSDCDPQERVWAWNPVLDHWKLSRINRSVHTHWLPANALPAPEAPAPALSP